MGSKETEGKPGTFRPINVKRSGHEKLVKSGTEIHSKTITIPGSKSKASYRLNGIKQTSLIGADEKVEPETKVPHTEGVNYGGIYKIKGHGTYLADSPKHALELAGLDSGKCTRLGDGVGKFGPYNDSTKGYQPEQFIVD
jgi:hypothetical protein